MIGAVPNTSYPCDAIHYSESVVLCSTEQCIRGDCSDLHCMTKFLYQLETQHVFLSRPHCGFQDFVTVSFRSHPSFGKNDLSVSLDRQVGSLQLLPQFQVSLCKSFLSLPIHSSPFTFHASPFVILAAACSSNAQFPEVDVMTAYGMGAMDHGGNEHNSTSGPNMQPLVVHTDGGCQNNGKRGAKASYGVWFGPGSQYNKSGLLSDNLPQTSSRAETEGVSQALKAVQDLADRGHTIQKVKIATDSQYVVKSMTE